MIHLKKWVLGSRTAFMAILLSLSALVGYAQCVSPGTPINFSTSGNNTASGYTTTYVLTDNSGGIIQTVSSGFAAPSQSGSFKVYAVNYNSASGNTAPTLTAGTNVTAVGGTCSTISSSPITFCVTASCVAPGTAINFSTVGNNTATGYTTTYVLTDAAGNIVQTVNSGFAAPNLNGTFYVYTVNYNSSTGNTAPTLTAGTNIAAIGGTCTAVSGSPLEICVTVPPPAGCVTGGSSVSFATSGVNTSAGYTTTYALTDNSGNIISTSSSSPIASPATSGIYNIYVVNYNSSTGNTPPTLTAGTNIGAIGGTCAAVSSSPVTFTVCAPATPVASVTQNPTSPGTSTGIISLTGSTGNYPPSTPVSVTYTTPGGGTSTFTGTTDGTGKINIPNLPAGTYGPFTVSVNGGTPSTPGGSATLVDPAVSAPDLTPTIYARASTIHNTQPITVVVDVQELRNVATSGLITVKVTKDPKTSLTFSSGSTSIDNRAVQNSAWNFDGASDPNFYILTTNQVMAGYGLLSFGLTGTLTPGATTGSLTVSSTIVGGSGGEVIINNNSDADKIDYFQQ